MQLSSGRYCCIRQRQLYPPRRQQTDLQYGRLRQCYLLDRPLGGSKAGHGCLSILAHVAEAPSQACHHLVYFLPAKKIIVWKSQGSNLDAYKTVDYDRIYMKVDGVPTTVVFQNDGRYLPSLRKLQLFFGQRTVARFRIFGVAQARCLQNSKVKYIYMCDRRCGWETLASPACFLPKPAG